MKDRLIRLLDSEQLTASKFADRIGVQRSSVSHVLSGRNKPSFDFIQKTLKAFPDINPEWLIMGKGDMITGIPDYTGATLFDQGRREIIQKEASNEIPGDLKASEHPKRVAGYGESGSPEEITDNIRETERLQSVPGEGKIPKGPAGARKVVRVMLFYSDHTFTTYDPSE